MAPGKHAKAYYRLRFADKIGFPVFTFIGVMVISILLLVALDIPGSAVKLIILIASAGISMIFVVEYILQRRELRKIRKQSKEK